LAKIFLKKNEERRIKNGHLWIFSNEIKTAEGEAQNGDIIEAYDSSNKLLGHGFYNRYSLISVRLLAPYFSDSIEIYIRTALLKAYSYRQLVYPSRNSFRLAFSESDSLPGLIIDKYNDTYVMQVYSAGMQKNIEHIIRVLVEEFKAKNIFTKNESYFRKLEGLEEKDEVYLGERAEEIIDDGSIKYKIDPVTSQKTGFYFDQCDNRNYIEQFIYGKNVLDAFCNSGGFGFHAMKAGAGQVTFVDSSETEIKNAKQNYELNSFDRNHEFVTGDVFEYFKKCIFENTKYEVVILDPPAFAKSKKSLPTALKGYVKLNRLALQCTSENGFLITSSCSHHVSKENFISTVNAASLKSDRMLQLIHFAGASLDHPVLPAMEETSYLKFAVFRVC